MTVVREGSTELSPVEQKVLEGKAVDGPTLPELAKEANRLYREAEAALQTSAQRAYECGKVLQEARNQTGNGKWAEWVEANFDGSMRTAQSWMKLARSIPKDDTDEILKLSTRAALQKIKEVEESWETKTKPDDQSNPPDDSSDDQGTGDDPLPGVVTVRVPVEVDRDLWSRFQDRCKKAERKPADVLAEIVGGFYLNEWMSGFVTTGKTAAEREADKTLMREIRKWANENGHEVSPKGKIKQSIIDAYHSRGNDEGV